MKKTIFSFVFAIMFGMTLGSCGNGTTEATNGVDSTAVDSVEVVDTLVADTVAVDTVALVEVAE